MKYQKLQSESDITLALDSDMENFNDSIAAMLNTAMFNEHIDNDALRVALLRSGVVVRLDDGQRVWVACEANDNPSTYLMEFLAIGIALDVQHANGQPLVTLYTLSVEPGIVLDRTVSGMRKAMMLTVLGEDDPDVDTLGLSPKQRVGRSIRSALSLRQTITSGSEDVL